MHLSATPSDQEEKTNTVVFCSEPTQIYPLLGFPRPVKCFEKPKDDGIIRSLSTGLDNWDVKSH